MDALRVLGQQQVSTDLLSETGAGKRLKTLSKHSVAKVAQAAAAAMEAWKECIRKEQKQATPSKSEPASQTVEAGPSASSQPEPSEQTGAQHRRSVFKLLRTSCTLWQRGHKTAPTDCVDVWSTTVQVARSKVTSRVPHPTSLSSTPPKQATRRETRYVRSSLKRWVWRCLLTCSGTRAALQCPVRQRCTNTVAASIKSTRQSSGPCRSTLKTLRTLNCARRWAHVYTACHWTLHRP